VGAGAIRLGEDPPDDGVLWPHHGLGGRCSVYAEPMVRRLDADYAMVGQARPLQIWRWCLDAPAGMA